MEITTNVFRVNVSYTEKISGFVDIAAKDEDHARSLIKDMLVQAPDLEILSVNEIVEDIREEGITVH